MTESEAIEILHRENCSCVILSGDCIEIFSRRGVQDLLELLKDRPQMLDGAFVADKVIGKGAAALMALGHVGSAYADVISHPALLLLQANDIPVSYETLTRNIINRSGTDICPVEKLTADCRNAEECLPLIENFVQQMIKVKK